jgi:hypothetical protein
MPLKKHIISHMLLIAILIGNRGSQAYQSAHENVLDRIASQLHAPSRADIDGLLKQAQNSCSVAISAFSESAVGYALALDLNLLQLKELLSQPNPDPAELSNFEEKLRTITPGRNQKYVDDLQQHVSSLRKALSTSESSLRRATDAVHIIRLYLDSSSSSPKDFSTIRKSFSDLQNVPVHPDLLSELQRKLSIPNMQIRLRTRTLENIAQTEFTVPVENRDYVDGTKISTKGSISVSLVPSFGQSTDRIPILISAAGRGTLKAIATRPPASVYVDINVCAFGQQPLELHPQSIERPNVSIHAQLKSLFRRVQLNGPLKKIKILQNIISRVIQRKLAEQDPVLSRKVEIEISKRVEEEGYKLAFKINHFLKQSILARLESLDFKPHVSLASNDIYLVSRSLYAYPDQLGALTSAPQLQPELEKQLDWVTQAHESVLNNVLENLTGFQLNEATMRGIWQVQLKLTAPGWEQPASAFVPSQIKFSSQKPSQIFIEDHKVIATLHLENGTGTFNQEALPPVSVQLIYHLSPRNGQPSLQREIQFLTSSLSQQENQAWTNLLDRFFPPSLQPIPKFRPSMWKNYVALRYLNADDGWLTLGLTSISNASEFDTNESKHGEKP